MNDNGLGLGIGGGAGGAGGGGSFQALLRPLHGNKPAISLNVDGTTIFGRGDLFGITNQRVSRKQGELIASSATRNVHLKPLAVNPWVLKHVSGEITTLTKDSPVIELFHGDILSLDNGTIEFQLEIIADDLPTLGTDDAMTQEATQIDMIVEIDRDDDSNGMRGPSKRACLEDNPRISGTKEGVLINTKDLRIKRTIGTGTCGEVYEADWRGTRVAVKKIFRTLLHGDTLHEFQVESDMMQRLRHPNIVLFMGTGMISGRDMCIITEYVEKGALSDVLAKQSIDLPWNVREKMAMDAARGMNYLHTFSPPIIHRDLKSHNLLVGDNFTIKVTDFGLAKFQEEDASHTFCGTLPWTAPEVFSGKGYSEKADVYSYAIVLWEMGTRKMPYNGLNKPDIIVGVTTKNLRPPLPIDDANDYYVQLMTDCWNEDPAQRPSFAEVMDRLSQTCGGSLEPSAGSFRLTRTASMDAPTPMHLTEQFQGAALAALNNNNNNNNIIIIIM